jgi:hypothetical protein
MKLGNLKPVKKRSKLYMWFANLSAKLSGRYIKDCHPAFMSFVEKYNLATASSWYEVYTRRYNEIMKMLDSDKYRKFFYEAVDYKRGELKPLPVKWYVRIFDKIVYNLSKAYVFIFEHELYKKIKSFEKTSKSVVALTKKMDEYLASTTSEQRLSRMKALGIISNETFKDDFDILINRVSPDVIEKRNEEAFQAKLQANLISEPKMVRVSDEHRKLPDEVVKLLRKKQ